MPRPSEWRRGAGSPLNILQNELNRLLEDYLQPARYGTAEPPPTDLDPQAWSPAVDIYESNEEMIVVVEVPGVDPAGIDLAVTGNVLSIRGSKEPPALPESVPHLRERRFGAFHRQLSVPDVRLRQGSGGGKPRRPEDPDSQAKCREAAYDPDSPDLIPALPT